MKLCLAVIFCALVSCNHKREAVKDVATYSGNIILAPLVDSLLTIYSQNHKGAFYVIYFDKKDDVEYRLTFGYSRQRVLPNKMYSTYQIPIHDSIPVYLFSGIEDFISLQT